MSIRMLSLLTLVALAAPAAANDDASVFCAWKWEGDPDSVQICIEKQLAAGPLVLEWGRLAAGAKGETGVARAFALHDCIDAWPEDFALRRIWDAWAVARRKAMRMSCIQSQMNAWIAAG